MKTEVKFLLFSGAFSLAVGVVYWFISYEEAGTLFLLLMGGAAALMGGYLMLKARGAVRAEDDPNADHRDEAGSTLGYFNSGSIWPFTMALGILVATQGFVYGRWLIAVGAVVFTVAAIGMMQESQS